MAAAERKSPNWIRLLVALFAGAAILWIVYLVRAVLAPLAAGLLLAYVLNPIVSFLERKNWKRVWATAALFGTVVLVVVVAVWVVVPPAVHSSTEFVKEIIPKVKEKLPLLYERLQKMVGKETLDEWVVRAEEHLAATGGRVARGLLGKISSGVQGAMTVISWLVLVPIYAFFALIGMDPLWRKVKEAIPAPIRPRALATLGRIHRANAAFFRGQTMICLIKAILGCVLYFTTGLPFWLLVGLFHGLASFFPFVGVSVTFVVVAVLAFVDVGLSWALVWPIAALMVLEVTEGLVLQPMILGKETDLHPVMVILAFLICGELFGFFGLLLAIPLFSAGKILFEEYVVPLYFEVGGHVSAQFTDDS